uniref:Uncharacterized protein n=1 Tax=Triticum urartu TaxID=4572 RepID=A0A8R7TPM2_TRIUA
MNNRALMGDQWHGRQPRMQLSANMETKGGAPMTGERVKLEILHPVRDHGPAVHFTVVGNHTSMNILPTDMRNLWPAFSIRCTTALRQEITIDYTYALEGVWQIW